MGRSHGPRSPPWLPCGGASTLCGMSKPPIPPEMRRTERLQVTVTRRDLADLKRIAAAWSSEAQTIAPSTALYFLAAGRLAELRGEALGSGGDLVTHVSRWLAERLPEASGSPQLDTSAGPG